jgi:iron complex transport system ATP-binding protein
MARLAAEHPHLATVTVTHHVEELPASTTHVLLLRDGAVSAAGPIGEVLTDARLSAGSALPVVLERVGDRWTARARPATT